MAYRPECSLPPTFDVVDDYFAADPPLEFDDERPTPLAGRRTKIVCRKPPPARPGIRGDGHRR